VLYLLHRKFSRISLLEIDHSRDRAYLSIPQPKYHDIFLFSHEDRLLSLSSCRNRVVSLLDGVSFFSLILSILVYCISYRYRASIPPLYINREVICLNRCRCTFSRKNSYKAASGPILSQIQQSPSWRLLTRIKSLHTDK
jgi:hypothetical protein